MSYIFKMASFFGYAYLGAKNSSTAPIRCLKVVVQRSRKIRSRDKVLVLVTLSLTGLDRVESDLLVVLLQGGQVLTGLGELALLHTLADVPGEIDR